MSKIKNIVLVHGFWADGSCYRDIIPTLLAEGFEVIAVQNPLTSLADDAAATKRTLNRIDGQCILVGHSWGGTVISEVGNDERVSGLVYIAAMAPDTGESLMSLMSKYGDSSPHIQEEEGFLWISKAGIKETFASDLLAEQIALIYATQTPPSASLPETKIENPAWKHKPSWYLIANQDLAIPPELQREFSVRMQAKTVVVESSHVPMISHTQEVLKMIREAAANC
ncbi:MAG: alpha/beta hydrolase [Cyanobacteria bacterium J06592_8]